MSTTNSDDLPIPTICGINIPDTPSVRSTHAFIKTHLDAPIYNHVMRAMFYGFIISSKIPDQRIQSRDLEIHAVSAMMHDLAINPECPGTKPFVSKDKRFEVDSGDEARNFLVSLDGGTEWTERRTQLVWDAIALHATRSIAMYKEPEVCCTSLGVGADFVPPTTAIHPRFSQSSISEAEQTAVEQAYPRDGFVEFFKNACCSLCSSKPQTTYDNWVGAFGEVFVDGYTVVGTRLADRMEKELKSDAH